MSSSVTTLRINRSLLPVRTTSEPNPVDAPALWPSIGEYPCYDDVSYGMLTSDNVRNERFLAALRRYAAGQTVLDIGTGQDALWARAAHDVGAERVFAIEAMPESFGQARNLLEHLGMADEIMIFNAMSTEFDIEARAQVCVAEIIGSVAGAEGAAAVIHDARQRLLTPDAVVIPDRCRTWAAAACLKDLLGRQRIGFAPESLVYLRKIFDATRGPFDVRLRVRYPVVTGLLSEPGVIENLEFNGDLKVEQETAVTLVIRTAGRVDGILAWMDIRCVRDEAPLDGLTDPTSWASIYFPLFDAPTAVRVGDVLDLQVRVVIGDDGLHPDYHFRAALHTAAGTRTSEYISRHHGGQFRGNAVYRCLFPSETIT